MQRKKKSHTDESQWLSVSDLMSGLMMVFLFISIAMMQIVNKDKDAAVDEKKRIEQIVKAYQENKTAIYDALQQEFAQDLKKWDAEIDRNSLTFTFKSPDILFAIGKDQLTPKFKEVLDDFFPRYLTVLTGAGGTIEQDGVKSFKSSITEIRIEGHTDSTWATTGSTLTDKDIYYNNMDLSQGRTRSVLTYIYDMSGIAKQRPWMRAHIAAVGLSSSHPVFKESACNSPEENKPQTQAFCTEDLEKSRRVSFRILTNAEQQVQKILATF
ncbi:OmpA family protein [Thiothrix lacustris]|uniref:OmpA family protein n=1 Tax=Thiothrix lacustris TaxID=525917 RepID=A0ABY9MVF6_9GAMM|nr:OmpA family protein [Thiothrix lacustris]WML91370.1 OmpA family protein [Thiothrix lacustris]